jgi:hypothetical protein
MPDFDFDAFNHEYPDGESESETVIVSEVIIVETSEPPVVDPEILSVEPITTNGTTVEVDKW